jgi:hypothetical protein
MKEEKTKNNSPHPTPKRKNKCLLNLHWLHEISISKTVCHHFWPGLMGGPELGHSPVLTNSNQNQGG